MSSKRLAGCDKSLGRVAEKNPDYKDSAQLFKNVKKQKQLGELYVGAKKLHAEKKWHAVLMVFEQIFAIDPRHSDPDGLLSSAQKEVAELKHISDLNDLYSQSVREMDLGKWYEARTLLEQIHKAQTGFLETESLLRKVENEILKIEKINERSGQVNTLYEQAYRLLRSRSWRNALDKLEEIKKLDSQFEDKYGIAEKAKAQLEQEVQKKVTEHEANENITLEKAKSEPKKRRNLKISVAYPKLLSKRYASSFLLQIYLSDEHPQVIRNIKSEFKDQKTNEYIQSSFVELKQEIKVKFFSPTFNFSEPVTKLVNKTVNEFTLLGIPKDNCEPGLHKVLISISDGYTEQEFESLTIIVQVVDFAFDHVSRPFLSKVASVFLFIGSFIMFGLSLVEQIDKTVGLTSGTTAAVLAIAIYGNFYSLFQRVRPNTP